MGAIAILSFFFLFTEGWGTQDSLIEPKFVGYYIAIALCISMFVRGILKAKSGIKAKSFFVFGFLVIPLIASLAFSYWYWQLTQECTDCAYYNNDFINVSPE